MVSMMSNLKDENLEEKLFNSVFLSLYLTQEERNKGTVARPSARQPDIRRTGLFVASGRALLCTILVLVVD